MNNIEESQELFNILRKLDEAKIKYFTQVLEDGSLSIVSFVVGEIWEITVSPGLGVGIETFKSSLEIEDITTVLEKIQKFKNGEV